MSIAATAGEKQYEVVYGETFQAYNKQEILEFIEPLKIRFQRNHLDASTLFAGKTCFDAGCGGGRGALFMLMNGAKEVTAYDIYRNDA